MQEGKRPFAGVRVLDFSQVYAGPSCAALLAALGADVIKVETASRLDTTRRRRPGDRHGPPGDVNAARPYHLMNHNKRSVTVNLQSREGRDLVLRLVRTCDLVIEAFRPGVMERLGLGFERLRDERPDLLMLSISGNGQHGPEARYAGYAAIFAALGGVSYLTGYPGGMPTEYRGSADLRVGLFAFFACTAAILRRKRTGEGGYIDLAGREVMAALVGDAIVQCAATGEIAEPAGNDDRIMAPHGLFRTAEPDTWLVLAVGSQDEWLRFCRAAGLSELSDDARFADGFRRWKHREALHDVIRAWAIEQNAHTTIEQLQKNGVAVSLCYRMGHVMSDEHLIERGALYQATYGPTGQVTLPALSWRIEQAPDYYEYAPGGALGEHNADVFIDLLGVTSAEMARYFGAGALT